MRISMAVWGGGGHELMLRVMADCLQAEERARRGRQGDVGEGEGGWFCLVYCNTRCHVLERGLENGTRSKRGSVCYFLPKMCEVYDERVAGREYCTLFESC